MSEDEAKEAAREDAEYLWSLLREGVPLEVATRMVSVRILSRILAEASKPPKEPWEK